MLSFFARTALSIIGNALGLLIASWIVPGFDISIVGFTISVLFFTGAQILFSPLILKLAIKHMPTLRGGIALVTTLVALFLTAMFTDGLQIGSVSAWVISPLIVWITTVLAGVFLPMIMFKKLLSDSVTSRDTE